MTAKTDSELLKTYADRRLEPAFTELVRRHVDFVYSAAIRLVRDPHLAEDVTQGVFIALAKESSELAERATLAGWLHRTALNIASKTVRTIERRRVREQEAVAMNELASSLPEAPWEQIEPYLDAALSDLTDSDRDAVLMRFYERKSAAEMASILEISDEAAQKRVSRAVERLREFFAKRGVTVSAGSLTVTFSANAVQAAPAGLALAISTAGALTGTTLPPLATATATKAIAMTAIQKTIVAATIAILAGVGIYEARQASQLREQNQTLQQLQTSSNEHTEQLQREHGDSLNNLAALREDNERLKHNGDELLRLRAEVAKLRNEATRSQQNDPAPRNGTNRTVVSIGLSPQQTVQIREASKGSEMSDLITKLETAQKDALNVVLQETANEDVIRQKLEAVAVVQLQIAVLRYEKGVKSVLPSISDEQKGQMLETHGFAYSQLFVGSTAPANTEPWRGGRFVPQQQ